MIRYLLLILPIHRRSYKKYYSDHDKYVSKMKIWLEKSNILHKFSFDDLSDSRRIFWEEQWFWPPWLVNDIMGFLNIGSDYDRLVGNIYLKRKYFPLDSYNRAFRKYDSTRKKNEFLYYPTRMHKYWVIRDNNDSYVKAVLEIIQDSREIIKKISKGADIWLPGYDLSCLNL